MTNITVQVNFIDLVRFSVINVSHRRLIIYLNALSTLIQTVKTKKNKIIITCILTRLVFILDTCETEQHIICTHATCETEQHASLSLKQFLHMTCIRYTRLKIILHHPTSILKDIMSCNENPYVHTTYLLTCTYSFVNKL